GSSSVRQRQRRPEPGDLAIVDEDPTRAPLVSREQRGSPKESHGLGETSDFFVPMLGDKRSKLRCPKLAESLRRNAARRYDFLPLRP
ncbi:MAG TPA: hypothetical protein VMO88_05430, partial [Acidimicrobiales bacterium]|nr:hypothetical protein [Acidimicrobiales bacterium]